ncbi:MAG: transporter substrate-binding domain-containing protein [Desulfuromonadaceae bacterium]|nr:transporter substrate-binding domain-containing protein [Desulfuromonas sp.]MDY0185127.1 transporter substrate-binding domain-containing protein [Desulfuromonadaceae bacterium]
MQSTPDSINARKLAIWFVLAICLALTGCSDSSNHHREILTVATIEQAPNSYTENGSIVGTDVDIAKLVAADSGIDLKFEMLDAAQEAIEITQAGPNRALLGIAYSAERADLFQWVGPISKGRYVIFAKKSTGIGSNLGLEKAQGITSIAVVEGWLETTTLEKIGFTNLKRYPSYAEAYQAFDTNEVMAIASDLMQLVIKVRGKYVIVDDMDLCFTYKTPFYYMAVSKDVEGSVIDAMQQHLNARIMDESTLTVVKDYFPTAIKQIIPDVLQLMTEVSPPFIFKTGPINNYSLEGSSIDVVTEIQRRNGYQETIHLTTWVDGSDIVQYLPYSAYFTTVRTPEREESVQWVGPITAMHPGLYTLASKNLEIANLAAAKGLSAISTPYSWPSYLYLLDQGFTNVDGSYHDNLQSFQGLLNGEVDATFIDAEAIDWLCEKTGTARAAIVLQFEEPAAYQEGWIAFSHTTPEATIKQWQASLDAMRADGTFAEIWQKWFGDAPLPTGELAPR